MLYNLCADTTHTQTTTKKRRLFHQNMLKVLGIWQNMTDMTTYVIFHRKRILPADMSAWTWSFFNGNQFWVKLDYHFPTWNSWKIGWRWLKYCSTSVPSALLPWNWAEFLLSRRDLHVFRSSLGSQPTSRIVLVKNEKSSIETVYKIHQKRSTKRSNKRLKAMFEVINKNTASCFSNEHVFCVTANTIVPSWLSRGLIGWPRPWRKRPEVGNKTSSKHQWLFNIRPSTNVRIRQN